MKASRAEAIGNGVFLILLGVLFYFSWLWPGILLAVWASFAVRQLLTGRHTDFVLTTLLLGSLFLVIYFNLSWNMLTPILFILGGGYLIYKEFFIDVPKKERDD